MTRFTASVAVLGTGRKPKRIDRDQARLATHAMVHQTHPGAHGCVSTVFNKRSTFKRALEALKVDVGACLTAWDAVENPIGVVVVYLEDEYPMLLHRLELQRRRAELN